MINVLKAGFYTSIQDRGRVGFAAQGVPVSGVMDSCAAGIVNSLLQNNLDDAVLEITFGGTQLEFLTNTYIAISGADFNPIINHKQVKLNSRIHVKEGAILSFGKASFGVRSYLAVKGGFQTSKTLESRSQFKNITKNFRIEDGDILKCNTFRKKRPSTNALIKISTTHFNTTLLECYEGPEFYRLSLTQKEILLNTVFTITADNSRMGYRLEEKIPNNLSSILTTAVFPGTVQLTPSGKLIVLMRDCQVTGGYSRILQLTENAINQLAQKTTNHSFKFMLNCI